MRWFIIQLSKRIKLELKYPIKILNRIVLQSGLPWNIKSIFCNRYAKFIYKKLMPIFIESLNNANKNSYKHVNSGIIWLFWWQGEKQMPLIVKRCIQSIIDHANGHEVVLITKSNITDYTNIPAYIYNKLYRHEMTLTHFSDILRFNLLNNHGGLWIDSTVFCSSVILNKKYFGRIYTSGGYDISQSRKFFSGKWTEFLIGGASHEVIFQFMNEFFKLYWKYHDYLLDYFLVDYGLDYIYHNNISNFKYYVNNIANHNNPHLYFLVDYLNKRYDNLIYNELTKDTNLFKLTYKKKFNAEPNTFYNKLVNKDLY